MSWCVANCLDLNVVKTKELVIDFRSGVHHPTPININGQHIEILHSYKYMGTSINDKLRWDDNTINLYKKGQQKLYFLIKLNALHTERNILFVTHESFVNSVMTFGLVCWWWNLSVKNREKLNRIYTSSVQNRYVLYTRYQSGAIVQVKNIANGNQNMLSEVTHFLHDHYDLLPSGKRYRMPTVNTQRALKSFIPSSIKYLNQPQ